MCPLPALFLWHIQEATRWPLQSDFSTCCSPGRAATSLPSKAASLPADPHPGCWREHGNVPAVVSGMRAVAKWLPISWSNAKLLGLPDPPGQFLTLGPRHAAPGRMWFLGFAPSTPFLPIFPHLHSAGAPNSKGPAPINTSHTCRWVTAAWFRAQTSQNFSLCYCTFYSWLGVSCVVLSPRRIRTELFLLQPPVPFAPLPVAPCTSQHF